MAWFDEFNLPGATIDGYFGFIHADGPDDDDNPDVVLANGTVTFTATTEAARVDGAWLGIQPVTAQIFEGKIVISEEDPRPVRLLATDAPIGVADWAWRASFNVPGFRLNDLTFRSPRNTTVNLTADLIPIKSQPYQIIEGASIVDAEVSGEGTMRFKLSDGSFTRWMDVPNGERGLPGEKGTPGARGADGTSATLAMGSVTAGATADAWMTGTPLARELNLVLPRGQKGDKGDTGDKGDPGDPATPVTASVTVTTGDEWDASVTFTGGNLGLDFTAAPAGPHSHPTSEVYGLSDALAARPLRSSSHVWHRTLDAGESLDPLRTRGYFGWTKPNAPTHPGIPPGVTEQGIVEVLVGQSDWTSMQRATEAVTGREWVRMMRNPGTNQWWPWREKAFLDNDPSGDGGTARLSPDWIHFGDSHTDDVVLGASQWTRVLAGLTGRSHDTRGWYNQRSFEIAARAGATLYPVTVTGGSIPATGPVAVVGQREQQLAFGGYAGLMSRTIPGWLAGRHGTLRNPDNGAGMTFTPDDNAAAPTTVTGTAWFEGDATAGAGRILTVWIGANDRSREKPAVLVGLVREMLARVPHSRAYVFGIFPGSGGAYAGESRAISNAYRAEWPDLYFDPLHALTQEQAATDAGITFTAQDQADIAAGIVPSSFRSDGVHLNASGARALARAVFRDAIARGWTQPGNGETGARQQLPPLPSSPVTVEDVAGLGDRLGSLEYDSGWRNVSADLEPGIGGNVFISRRGQEVHMMFHNVTTTTEGHREIYQLPAGFRPTAISGANWRNGTLATDNGDTVRQASFFNNRMRVLNMPTGKSLGGYIVFRVPPTLPTTIPGDAA